jgi:hypothetical protein
MGKKRKGAAFLIDLSIFAMEMLKNAVNARP